MKRILVSTTQTLRMAPTSQLMSAACAVLGLGVCIAIFTMASTWLPLPMIGTAAVILAYKRTF